MRILDNLTEHEPENTPYYYNSLTFKIIISLGSVFCAICISFSIYG